MSNRIKNLTLKEISAVTKPAQEGALMSIIKQSPLGERQSAYLALVEKAMTYADAKAQNEFREVVGELDDDLYECWWSLMDTFDSITRDENLSNEAKLAQLAVAVADFANDVRNTSVTGDEEMTDKTAELDALKGELEALKAEYETLKSASEAEIAALKASVEAITTENTTLKAAPEEYVTAGDVKIAKSTVSAEVYEALRAQNEAVEKAKAEADDLRVQKVAEDELGGFAGDISVKAKVIRMFEKADDEVRNFMKSALSVGLSTLAKAAQRNGIDPKSSEGNMSPYEKLNVMAKARAEESGISINAAYLEVLKTDEGKELYKQSNAA